MIVRAQTPLMRGAQLTPARRNYTGPRRGLGLVPRRGMGDSCPAGFVMYAPTGTCTQTPEFRLAGIADEYARAAQLGQLGDPPPTQDQLAALIAGEAKNLCNETFIPCGSGVQAIVQQAAANYTPPAPSTTFYGQAAQAAPPPAAPAAVDPRAGCGDPQASPILYAQCLARNLAANPVSAPVPVTVKPVQSNAPAPAAAAALDAVTLVQKLKAAAGAGPFNGDQWNYYRNTIAPPALTPDQFTKAFPGAERPNISAEDFVLALHNVGLAGYRRTMHGARRTNYVRRRVALA